MADNVPRTRLLTWVDDAEEATMAAAGGADLIGLESPSPDIDPATTLKPIVAAFNGKVPVVASLGPASAGPVALAAAAEGLVAAGAAWLRVDFADWEEARARLPVLAPLTRRGQVFAVLPDVDAPAADIVPLLAEAGFAGVLIRAGASRSLDRSGPGAIAAVMRAGRSHGLTVGVTGAIEPPDIPRLRPFAPEILGVRDALLGADGRIDPGRVAALRQLISGSDPDPSAGRRGPDAEDRIFVRDFTVAAPIGAYARERDRPQRVRFTVEVAVPRRDRMPEDMRDVLSYDIITDAIREIVASGHVTLAETLAERVAAAVLAHPAARRVNVRVEKLDVIDGSVGAEIVRRRAEPELGDESPRTREPADDKALRCEGAIPILRIFSVDKFREFYLGFLGFGLDWAHGGEGSPLYAQVSRAGIILHVSEHHGDATPGSTAFVPIRGIDALHRELTGKRYPYGRPGIEQLPWGRVLETVDPFGNRLRFCERRPTAT